MPRTEIRVPSPTVDTKFIEWSQVGDHSFSGSFEISIDNSLWFPLPSDFVVAGTERNVIFKFSQFEDKNKPRSAAVYIPREPSDGAYVIWIQPMAVTRREKERRSREAHVVAGVED